MSIIIEGIPELKTAFVIFQQKLFNAVTTLVDEVAKEGAKNAQKLVPMDTGALKGSIEGGITQITPMVKVEGQVGAGKESVVRGQGSYQSSSKGRAVGIRPTSKYVIPVEFGYGPEGQRFPSYFMSSTYIYLKELTLKKAKQLLNRAMQRA